MNPRALSSALALLGTLQPRALGFIDPSISVSNLHLCNCVEVNSYVHVQVKEPRLQARCSHSASAFTLNPGLTEVILFGGYPEWPKNSKSYADFPQIANTTVLRFGESTSCVSHTSYSLILYQLEQLTCPTSSYSESG